VNFISCLTLELGRFDRFLIIDYAVVHALRNIMREGEELSELIRQFIRLCDHVFSYDNSCGYSVNAVDRFLKHFPEEAEFIQRTRWLIPLLHVQNHKDNCMYNFSCAYTEGACHFQGETAEMTWVELNQLAPQTRQMNNGHRQDTIIDHHSHWNWVKTSNIGRSSSSFILHCPLLSIWKYHNFSMTLFVQGASSVKSTPHSRSSARSMQIRSLNGTPWIAASGDWRARKSCVCIATIT